MKVIEYIASKVASWYLTRKDIAWIDNNCGCPRSPDTKIPSKCPEHDGEFIWR